MFRSFAILLCSTIIGLAQVQPKQSAISIDPPISGESYLAIEKAYTIFKKHLKNPDLRKYDIVILRIDNQLTVGFENKNRPDGVKGNPGPLPEFEVVLSKATNELISWNFVR